MKILKCLCRQLFCLLVCLLLGVLAATSVQADTVINATLVEDTYVNSGSPDTNFDGDSYRIFTRNYEDYGRAGIIQFNLPQLPAGQTVTDVNLSGVVSYTRSGRNVALRLSTISVNPDLTAVTYNNLCDPNGDGVFTDYIKGTAANFTYGNQATSLDKLYIDSANISAGDIITFSDTNSGILNFIKSKLDGGNNQVTLAVGPGDTGCELCEFRFCDMEGNADSGSSTSTPMSLTLRTNTDTYSLPLIEDTFVNCNDPDDNFDGNSQGILVRNHSGHGRAALVQFDMSGLPVGLSAADIISAELKGMASYDNGKNMELEVLGLDVNPILTSVTYNNLFDAGGANVFTDYDPDTNGGCEFVLGSQSTELATISFNTSDTPSGTTLTFTDDSLLNLIKSSISATEDVTVTFVIDPAGSDPGKCDHRFYDMENTDGQNPISLAITLTETVPEPSMIVLLVMVGCSLFVWKRIR